MPVHKRRNYRKDAKDAKNLFNETINGFAFFASLRWDYFMDGSLQIDLLGLPVSLVRAAQ